MKKPLKIVLLLSFIVALYLVTNKGVVPFVLKIIDSELYMKQTEDDPVGELHNDRVYTGLLHCENQLRADRGASNVTRPSVTTGSATEGEYKAWGVGDHIYVIKAKLDVPDSDKGPMLTSVACKIKYEGGEATDPKNWSILGVGAEGG